MFHFNRLIFISNRLIFVSIFIIHLLYICFISTSHGKKYLKNDNFILPMKYFNHDIDHIQQFDGESLRNVLQEKLEIAKNIISKGNKFRTALDPLNLDSLFVLLDDENTHLNVSITSINFHGLSHMQTKDIASNEKTKKVGILLQFPQIKITGVYRIHGVWSNNSKKLDIEDKGKFQFDINEWRNSLSAKIVEFSNSSLKVSQMAMRSHIDKYNDTFDSFINKDKMNDYANITKIVSSIIMDKVVNIIDEKLEELFGEIVTEENLEEELDLLEKFKTHLNQHSKSHSRRKRQVPCEVGDELDEYVDSLFRFAKRLLRVMEPFQLPNVTIDVDDYNLQLFLHNGMASRIYTFERKKPAWVLCNNETLSLGLTIQVEEIRIMYKYRVIQDWRLLFDGELEAQLKRPKIQVQFSQSVQKELGEEESDEEEEPVMQRIDKLKVWRPGSIRVIIRGLGNLTQGLSMLINSILTNTENFDPLINMLETDGVAAANELLKNVTIPILSVV